MQVSHGDFSGLAADYSSGRPDYSPAVLSWIRKAVGENGRDPVAVDVGAGTGIWTRMLASTAFHRVIAIEPNADMRNQGAVDSNGLGIEWVEGSAENTGMPAGSADLVTMASSFHWADKQKAFKEFNQILKARGIFCALWNPRMLPEHGILADIEAKLHDLNPDIKRRSSGLSGITQRMTDLLEESRYFDDVIYMEASHQIVFTPERYIAAWRSVNDIRVQLGPARFDQFIDFIHDRISGCTSINAQYLTRAWLARAVK